MRSKLLVLVVGLACVLLACEQIIGLDKFKKCDVDIACASDASDAEVDASDAGDASDAFTFPDGVSEASSWARWRMDNTPTEVNGGAPDASRTAFDAAVPNELADTVSGLVWSTNVGVAPNVTAASDFCTKNGYRLPTRIEMVTLLDTTNGAPWLTPQIATVVSQLKPLPSALWTSSYVRPLDGGIEFWFANLTTGDIYQSPALNTGVLCVR